MTFSAQNSHSGNPFKINCRKIWFNVSEISEKENIMTAELRLYRDLDKNIKPNEAYNITIYRYAHLVLDSVDVLWIFQEYEINEERDLVLLNHYLQF
ncbi:unnamed protein product [Heterotrigona itama]|uniref:TGF-beta propeptide domain-containing protein n=1 Tax=Heterotrigona itama TaxID=395501 RepID=A0A6V7HIL8_9HYME|nr:unnamed protein product [Heterotrigona itama]